MDDVVDPKRHLIDRLTREHEERMRTLESKMKSVDSWRDRRRCKREMKNEVRRFRVRIVDAQVPRDPFQSY